MDMQTFEQWESEIRGYCRAYPTVFKSASNARQTDENGKEYIDFFAGAGVLNYGHNNPRMKEALKKFIDEDGIAQSLDMYTTTKREFIKAFAETILKPRDMDHKMQFVGPTGTNVVEAALKLARRVTGRNNVVAFSHGFHGMTLGSLACTANDYFRNAAGVPLLHVERLPFETSPGGGLEQLAAYNRAIKDASSGLKPPAAFIVEPIQAEGGVNVASVGWLKTIQNIAREHGALLIFDDIQASNGRTGNFFSFDGMGLDPDIICLAKGAGGFGTPIGVNLIKPEYDKHWQPGEHTGTFRGQGFSFVAGREALRYYEDDALMKEAVEKGQMIHKTLNEIAARHKDKGLEVRGKAMIQGIDIQDGPTSKAIAKACFENGLLVGPCGTGGQVIKIIPPLTIPMADLEKGLGILSEQASKVLEGN